LNILINKADKIKKILFVAKTKSVRISVNPCLIFFVSWCLCGEKSVQSVKSVVAFVPFVMKIICVNLRKSASKKFVSIRVNSWLLLCLL
jgi:hypothetical protein